jgi:hypothetical protein
MAGNFNPAKAYEQGLVGARFDPRADEEFEDSILRAGGQPDGGVVAHRWEFAENGKGKLTLLFPSAMEVFPDYLPGPSQNRGDCVARAAANCLATSLALEIHSGEPDEVTGRLEGKPELPEDGVRANVVASESLWAWRGYNRDGWVCSRAAQIAGEKGFLIRKPYPELGIDLTRYTESTNRLGGSSPPGSKWLEESSKHVARTATKLSGREQVRDFLAQGYCVFNCSSLGFSNSRNEDGWSAQRGSWAHAQTWIGYDDRPSTVQKYGQPLVLWQNSWGKWNSGSRKVRGTNINIPHGSYWANASTIDQCSCIALSSVAGWPRRKLPTYGAEENL